MPVDLETRWSGPGPGRGDRTRSGGCDRTSEQYSSTIEITAQEPGANLRPGSTATAQPSAVNCLIAVTTDLNQQQIANRLIVYRQIVRVGE